MKKLNLCVFCGSSPGHNAAYTQMADSLGQSIAKNNWTLVYGGGNVGLMGTVADSTLKSGGEVIGVIPKSLVEWEVAHEGLTKLHIVDNMHLRKFKMYDLSDGFVAIPGGMGTLDELCEIITWAQLEYHTKPIYILNEGGFFDHLLKHFDYVTNEGFLQKEHRDWIQVVSTVDELVESFTTSAIPEK